MKPHIMPQLFGVVNIVFTKIVAALCKRIIVCLLSAL